MDSYSKLQDWCQKPNLTTVELNTLLERIGSEYEEEAVAEIIERYQKTVVAIAKRMFYKVGNSISGASMLDFVQQGNIALWTAIKTYDSSKGAFTPYAKRGVTSALIRLIENTVGIVRKPARVHERWRKLRKQILIAVEDRRELELLDEIITSPLGDFDISQATEDNDLLLIEEEEFLLLVEKGLSKRHKDALRKRLDGFSNTEIARHLHLSRKTVISLFRDLKNAGTTLNEIREKLARAAKAETFQNCPVCGRKLKRDEWKYCAACRRV